MLKIEGKYTNADVMLEDYSDLEEETSKQISTFINHPVFKDSKISIMPDCHSGSGSCIGFTSIINILKPIIIPNIVGVDIGCGVSSYLINDKKEIDFERFHNFLIENVPSGFNKHSNPKEVLDFYLDSDIKKISCRTEQNIENVLCSLGTLGGGNHFIEIDKDDQDRLWLTIHTGSRNFGLRIANFHQAIAKEIKNYPCVSNLEYLTGKEAQAYFDDMIIAQAYAKLNRALIAEKILIDFFNQKGIRTKIESIHNYIEFQKDIAIIRKGAISAYKGQNLIIPLNMRDGIIIGKGKENIEWNYSAPHGAGRILARSKAKKTLSLDTFKKTMENVWSKCISKDTLDESPMAYKDSQRIIDSIKDTVDIEFIMKPVFNFKAQ
ncbi:RtcB family protein [Candidatus Pacearchaeota archaeon]|nr:RtcB family protein [Candidatus Pacearchaeota archaeon]